MLSLNGKASVIKVKLKLSARAQVERCDVVRFRETFLMKVSSYRTDDCFLIS